VSLLNKELKKDTNAKVSSVVMYVLGVHVSVELQIVPGDVKSPVVVCVVPGYFLGARQHVSVWTVCVMEWKW
jgi:hypothetical protein